MNREPLKLDIKTLGDAFGNNYLTERIVVDKQKIILKDAIKTYGVINRMVSYKITKNGVKIKYILLLNTEDCTKVEVNLKIWNLFEALPIILEKTSKKKYYKSK